MDVNPALYACAYMHAYICRNGTSLGVSICLVDKTFRLYLTCDYICGSVLAMRYFRSLQFSIEIIQTFKKYQINSNEKIAISRIVVKIAQNVYVHDIIIHFIV